MTSTWTTTNPIGKQFILLINQTPGILKIPGVFLFKIMRLKVEHTLQCNFVVSDVKTDSLCSQHLPPPIHLKYGQQKSAQ
jgi:hypothetical protein